uniref:Uncharacterized protein n=1 Tax=Octopus bimaculoides TaxID=37653 RepID=A0A0L8GJS7_OCTBM
MYLVYPYQTGSHDGYSGIYIFYPSITLMACTAFSLNNNNNNNNNNNKICINYISNMSIFKDQEKRYIVTMNMKH